MKKVAGTRSRKIFLSLAASLMILLMLSAITPQVAAAEPNLNTVLNDCGFRNRSLLPGIHTIPPGIYAVEMIAEWTGAWQVDDLNWYDASQPVGPVPPLNLIFAGPLGCFGYVCPSCPGSPCGPVKTVVNICLPNDFGLCVHTTSNNQFFYTEPGRNQGGLDQAQFYINNDDPSMMLMCFELAYAPDPVDWDFQDLVVSLKRYPKPVGGVWVPVDKLGLLAPYIGLASTIVVATVATAIYAKRVKRRKEKL